MAPEKTFGSFVTEYLLTRSNSPRRVLRVAYEAAWGKGAG